MDKANSKLTLKEKLAKAVCLFLAEMLRTRQVSLKRSAEIARAIVERLERVDSEEEFLRAVKKLETDFQELRYLRRDLLFYHHIDGRSHMEELVREHASNHVARDPKEAVKLMEEALRQETELPHLRKKYPEFDKFVRAKEALAADEAKPGQVLDYDLSDAEPEPEAEPEPKFLPEEEQRMDLYAQRLRKPSNSFYAETKRHSDLTKTKT